MWADIVGQYGEGRLDRSDRRGGSFPAPYNFRSRNCLTSARPALRDAADIEAAGQVTHAEPQQPALELEILAHAADPHSLAVTLRRSSPIIMGIESRRRSERAEPN